MAQKLSLTYPSVLKEIRVRPTIRVLPSGTLSEAMDLEQFRHGKSTVVKVVRWTFPLEYHAEWQLSVEPVPEICSRMDIQTDIR